MRHPWIILASLVVAAQSAPDAILARRLEQDALFAQRTGRTALAVQQLEMAQLLQPISQREQMLNYLHHIVKKTKGEPHD